MTDPGAVPETGHNPVTGPAAGRAEARPGRRPRPWALAAAALTVLAAGAAVWLWPAVSGRDDTGCGQALRITEDTISVIEQAHAALDGDGVEDAAERLAVDAAGAAVLAADRQFAELAEQRPEWEGWADLGYADASRLFERLCTDAQTRRRDETRLRLERLPDAFRW